MRYHPDLTGTAPLVTQLSEDLVQAGEQVQVIASLPHYGRLDVHPDFRDRRGLFHISEHQGVRVWRTPVYVPPRPTFFHRALNYLSYTIFSVIAGLRAGKADVILAVNPPITTTFSAWITALIHRAPLVVGIQDIWPDCVILVGQLNGRLPIKISYWMERLQYKLASRVIVLSQAMKDNLLKKGVPEGKIAVIPNWADTDFVKPLPRDTDFRKGQGLQDHFVVLFAGNHGYNAALESVIEAASLLRSESQILFLFVGEGNVKSDLVAKVEKEHLENVRFLSTQPEHFLSEMLASADLGLVTLGRTLGELNVPSKVYTLMAAARPILAAVPGNSEVKSLVQNVNCGIWTPPEDPRALADAILDIHNRYPEIEALGGNGRDYLQRYLTRGQQTALYHQLLLEALNVEE